MEQPLLELLAIQMGCTYLSDLRFLTQTQRTWLVRKLERFQPREEDLPEWNDALEYLTGAPPAETAIKAQRELVARLNM